MKITKKKHLEEARKLFKKYKSSEKAASKLIKLYGASNGEASLARVIRSWFADSSISKLEELAMFNKAQKNKVGKSKYRIVSSAQNATPVNGAFWAKVLAYAEFLGAEINIVPMRYHNPTSTFTEAKNDYWSRDVQPYLVASRNKIHKNLVLLGDVKIQPTATMPLTSLEGLSGEESCIVAHTRQHFKTLPTLEGQPAKFLASTGSVTESNYTDSKAGKRADFHHTFGFVIIEELDDETFFIRQVSANKNGDFYDLDYKVTDKGVKHDTECVEIVTLGDIHLGDTDPVAMTISDEMLKRFKPKNVIFHDIMNGHSISHHEKRDPFLGLQREQDGSWDLEKELADVVEFTGSYLDYNPVIVKSNHDDFVDRWLKDNDWRKEKNKYAYLKYGKLKADGELPKGILPYEIQKAYGDQVVCLTEDESFKVRNNEFGVHGHIGANGSRGGANQFKKLNTKLITAHTHSPLKIDNLITVGTNTYLRLGYNKGLSGWFHANSITHKNGKTQLILIHGIKGYTTL